MSSFSCFTKPGCDLGTGKKKEQKLELQLFLQESGLAQPQPLAPAQAGPRAWRRPRGTLGASQSSPSRAPWAASLADARGPEEGTVLKLWDAEPGVRAGTGASWALGLWGPPRGRRHVLRGRAGCAGSAVVWNAPRFAALAAAPLTELSLGPGLGRKCQPFTSKICPKRKS